MKIIESAIFKEVKVGSLQDGALFCVDEDWYVKVSITTALVNPTYQEDNKYIRVLQMSDHTIYRMEANEMCIPYVNSEIHPKR